MCVYMYIYIYIYGLTLLDLISGGGVSLCGHKQIWCILVWAILSNYVRSVSRSVPLLGTARLLSRSFRLFFSFLTPNLPTNIIPTNIAWVKSSGKSPMDMRIPPLTIKIMLESNPLKPAMLVGRSGVSYHIILYSSMLILHCWCHMI